MNIKFFLLCFFTIYIINNNKITPKISIIMPIFNIKQEILKESIKSLIDQSLKEIEIILVNDASTDNSSIVLENFAENDSRIIIIHKIKNEMTGSARNSGINFSNGDFLGFLDYDDISNKESFSVAYKEAIKGNFTIVNFDYFNFNETKDYKKRRCNRKIQNYKTILLDENEFNVIKLIYVVPWNKIYKSSFFHKHNFKFFNTRGGEDALLLFTYFPYLEDKIKKIKSKQFFVCRRQRKESITYNELSKEIKIKIVFENLKKITFKKWEKDGIINLNKAKKIMAVLYGIAKIYNFNSYFKYNYLQFLKNNRKIFNKKFILKDNVRLFFWIEMIELFKDVNYNKFENIIYKNNKCKI